MAIEAPDRLLLPAPPAQAGASAERVAGSAVSTWRRIEAALCPIVGRQGFAALYKRSLHLTRAAHPWLQAPCDNALQRERFEALYAALSQQTTDSAAAAHEALLQALHDVLARLIGAGLSARLLQRADGAVTVQPAGRDAAP